MFEKMIHFLFFQLHFSYFETIYVFKSALKNIYLHT